MGVRNVMTPPENIATRRAHPPGNISISSLSPMSALTATPSTSYKSLLILPPKGSNQSHAPSISSPLIPESLSKNKAFILPAASSMSTSKTSLVTKPSNSSNASSSSWSKKQIKGKAVLARPDQKQAQRKDNETWLRTHKATFKCSTLLFKEVKDGMCHAKSFQSADSIAEFFNNSIGADMISGREIEEGVKNGLAGMYPPKRGRPTIISDEDTKNIAALVYSSSVIEQANCEASRLSRSELQSMVGEIVNKKLKKEGHTEINDVSFFERVQKINSVLCEVGSPDKRELLRSLWLTFGQQKKTLCQLGAILDREFIWSSTER